LYANFIFFASASGERRPPDHVSGLCPWTPLGDFRLPQPMAGPLFSIIPNPPCELHPIVKFWVRLWLRGQKMRVVHTGHTSLARRPGLASGEEKARGTGQQSPRSWKPCSFWMPEFDRLTLRILQTGDVKLQILRSKTNVKNNFRQNGVEMSTPYRRSWCL